MPFKEIKEASNTYDESRKSSCFARLAFRYRQFCQKPNKEVAESKSSFDYKIESNEDANQIINNLKVMKISDKCIQRILNSIDNMPGRDHVKGALKFLTEITAKKSQREDYYKYSNYIAEFFCTLSNLGLFAVAYYYGDFATLIAATFSALSHAIPSQRLHDLDILGVLLIFGKVAANYKIIMERPDALAWGVGAATINVMDTLITRKHLDKIGPSLHVVWHLSAALALYKFNQAQYDVNEKDIQLVLQAATQNHIPSFLLNSYEAIQNYISNCSSNKCVIC